MCRSFGFGHKKRAGPEGPTLDLSEGLADDQHPLNRLLHLVKIDGLREVERDGHLGVSLSEIRRRGDGRSEHVLVGHLPDEVADLGQHLGILAVERTVERTGEVRHRLSDDRNDVLSDAESGIRDGPHDRERMDDERLRSDWVEHGSPFPAVLPFPADEHNVAHETECVRKSSFQVISPVGVLLT